MKSEKEEFRNTVEFLTRNFWLNPATRSVELTPEGWVYFGEITQDISTELYNDPKKVNELAGRGSVILIESSLMGQVFESNSETKNLDHIDDANNLIKVPSSLNVDLIDEVIDQGDLISVKLKNGKQLLYNKTDIPVDELKRLEELKLLKGASNNAKIPRTGAEWNEYFKNKYGSGNVDWVTELKSYDDIIMNPKALWGKSADDVGKILGEGWTRGTYGSAGTGWKFTNGDKSVFYHPGGGVHEGSYVGISSGQMGKVKVVGSDYKPLAGDKATIIQK